MEIEEPNNDVESEEESFIDDRNENDINDEDDS